MLGRQFKSIDFGVIYGFVSISMFGIWWKSERRRRKWYFLNIRFRFWSADLIDFIFDYRITRLFCKNTAPSPPLPAYGKTGKELARITNRHITCQRFIIRCSIIAYHFILSDDLIPFNFLFWMKSKLFNFRPHWLMKIGIHLNFRCQMAFFFNDFSLNFFSHKRNLLIF